jgi:hypothetical protein
MKLVIVLCYSVSFQIKKLRTRCRHQHTAAEHLQKTSISDRPVINVVVPRDMVYKNDT